MNKPIDQANAVLNLLKDHGTIHIEIAGIKLKLELENRHERLYALNLKGGIRYPQADIDRLLIERITRSGDVVIDGGANIGVTALEFIRAGAGTVHCFEPEENLFSRLSSLSSHQIISYKAALNNRTGIGKLVRSISHNQGSTLDMRMLEDFPLVFGDEIEVKDVETAAIDDIFNDSIINIIKLDVEGLELNSLIGGVKTISSDHVRAIYLESYRDIQEISALLLKDFPYAYRVRLSAVDYRLSFSQIDLDEYDGEFAHTSPTYLFLKESIREA